MKLNLIERLTLLRVLAPYRGNDTTFRIVRTLRDGLPPSEAEYEEFEIRQAGEAMPNGTVIPPGQTGWNAKANEPKEITIGETATEIIVACLKRLNAKDDLDDATYDLFLKFVEKDEKASG